MFHFKLSRSTKVSCSPESVLGTTDSTLETVNLGWSATSRRNLLNVFNSIGHVRRGPEDGGEVRRSRRGARGPRAERPLVSSEFMSREELPRGGCTNRTRLRRQLKLTAQSYKDVYTVKTTATLRR